VQISESLFFNECLVPTPSDRTTSATAPEFLIAYVLFGLEIIILSIHYSYKRLREAGFREKTGYGISDGMNNTARISARGKAAARSNDDLTTGALEMEDRSHQSAFEMDENLTFRGYKLDPIGAATSATMIVTSLLWIILLAILVLDYYAVFSGFGFREESDMIFYDHSLLSKMFILVWYVFHSNIFQKGILLLSGSLV
jgi:hypothetical protein